MIIISMFISMSNFEMANDRLDYSIEKNKVSKEDADIYAKHMLNNTKTSMQQNKPLRTLIFFLVLSHIPIQYITLNQLILLRKCYPTPRVN